MGSLLNGNCTLSLSFAPKCDPGKIWAKIYHMKAKFIRESLGRRKLKRYSIKFFNYDCL